ncbi:MAG: hypothetical protein AAGA96_10830 [Verrucomicrobiota bacterium]
MARLSESTVDRVWHLGVEQIVPHNIDGSLAHAGMGPTVDIPITEEVLPQKPALEQLKDWFNGMRVVKYARTNPYSLSERHLAVVKKEVEEMLLESYKMDPSHYGAYNSYHLFLTTHDFGGTAKTREHAVNVANATLATVFQEDEDPEPWLTAASAAMNLYLLETEAHMVDGTDIPLETLKEYRSKIGYCLNRFEELQAQAEENGNWDNLSYDRQIEITHRHRFASRTFKQFDAMIARAEEPSSSAVPKSEVAGKASDED